MAEIGPLKRTIVIEPVPESEPVPEPAQPVKEPVPA